MPAARRSARELFAWSASGLIHSFTLAVCMAAAPWLPSIPIGLRHGQAEIVIVASFSPASATQQVTVEVPPELEPTEFPPDATPELHPVTEPVRRKDAEQPIERTATDAAHAYVPPPPPPKRKQQQAEKHPEHEPPKEEAKIERISVASTPSVSIRIVTEVGAIVDELPKKAGTAASTWNHHLGQKFSKPLPILDATVDHVSLLGTINEADPDCRRRIAELFRILKPGGKVQIRNLTSERDPGDAPINLPGPAAPVSFVPAHEALLAMLKEAGFTRAEITFHASSCCFQVNDIGLRDTRIEAVK